MRDRGREGERKGERGRERETGRGRDYMHACMNR